MISHWYTYLHMRVELRNIHKRFGSNHANNDVSLTVRAGSIHGLLGENGAGKSTLVKVLTGYISRDGGEILFDGKPVDVRTPIDGIRAGVGMLHQDPLDFPALTVLDNFKAGDGSGRAGRTELRALSQRFGFLLDPHELVGNLSVGERQQLELLRLLARGVRCLVLDEPTTGITAEQKTLLFDAARKLAADGKSVILVSHKLEDVEDVCDDATVMRHGEAVGCVSVKAQDGSETMRTRGLGDELVSMMFGRELAMPAKPAAIAGEISLAVRGLRISDDRLTLNVDAFSAQRGEVIGLAGVEGSGQRQFILACAGVSGIQAGQILIGGTRIDHQPYRNFQKAGVCYLPADRLREGLVPGLSIQEHVALRDARRPIFLDGRGMLAGAESAIAKFNIRGKPVTLVERLSGGNQQRTQLALMPDALSILLMEHPTRGLDIESTLWIWQLLLERCKQGTTIVFASSDLDEIVQYSDRVLVFSGGRVSAPVSTQGLTSDRLGELIGGRF